MLSSCTGVDEAEVGLGGISDCGDVGGGDSIDYVFCSKVGVDEIADFAWDGKEIDTASVAGHDEERRCV